ncbi:unnamed protein product [Owenia fusiformis]|uniref:Uncharacterized protein n=1 Tax=Owenia fusiformis TaxID=6347 RepID=A0A8S4PX29_OWEFU|nr:unnamed protein product [Owenia fusiformis]
MVIYINISHDALLWKGNFHWPPEQVDYSERKSGDCKVKGHDPLVSLVEDYIIAYSIILAEDLPNKISTNSDKTSVNPDKNDSFSPSDIPPALEHSYMIQSMQ